MPEFRKKPVVVEAKQWFVNGDHAAVTKNKCNEHTESQKCKHCDVDRRAHGFVETLEGGHIVCPGDWIIRGVAGEYYPCKPDIFEQTYEEVMVFTPDEGDDSHEIKQNDEFGGDITFHLTPSPGEYVEALKLCANGDIFVYGRLAENDIEVVEGLRKFMRESMKDMEE
jgi:hypothetical protein